MNDIAVIKNTKVKIKDLIIYFYIYAFIGWILEITYAFLIHKQFVNRGFLFGPICPIYGLGAVILILFLGPYKGKAGKEFFYSALAFTIFEYISSYMLEAIFNIRWWDYSNDFMNLQGRVSIAYSIIWGAMGIMLIEGIHPAIEKLLNKIKKHVNINSVLIVTIIILIIDLIFSVMKYVS